jgi:hypothetical protein
MKALRLIMGFLLAPACITAAYAQNESNSINNLVDAGSFVFEAQSVSPASGGIRQLTPSDYTLNISKDALVSHLPYFGRVYTAPVDPTKGGLEFTSKDFKYDVKDNKKKKEITIKTKDAQEDIQMYLTVYDNGSASLQVVSSNRQSISFNGHVRAKNTKGT